MKVYVFYLFIKKWKIGESSGWLISTTKVLTIRWKIALEHNFDAVVFTKSTIKELPLAKQKCYSY
jgi:hypothetical protein